MNILTHTQLQTAKTCLKKYCLSFVEGIKPDVTKGPLRRGLAVHLGCELLSRGEPLQAAFDAIRANYAEVPQRIRDQAELDEWHTECETCLALVSGYSWWWGQPTEDMPIGRAPAVTEVLEAELSFDIPLRNPETGASSRNYRLCGKIDRVVKLVDGRTAILETKTTSESIDVDSDYWRRLRLDSQISLYWLAATELGYQIETIIYDVVKMPTISRLHIPLLDADGLKIVADANGERVFNKNGEPRQSADSAKGWTLQARLQTPEEFSERLLNDISERPEFYFQRMEIPRLQSDLEEFQSELWQQQQQLSDCRRMGRWFRNTSACLRPYKCDYFDLCCSGWKPEHGVPLGFTRVENVNPELISVDAD
jgi:hypothetical protein